MVSNDDSLVSDVQNIDTIDLDTYYIGCDSRISISSIVTKEILKYWINTQNKLTVQRYLSLLGSAAIGDVLIEYSSTDSVKYGVALNGAIDSYKSILKTISNSQLDYTENNATILGWILDFVLNPYDVSNDYVLVTGAGVNAIDDNMATYDHHVGGLGVKWERSFSSRSISEVHSLFYGKRTSAGSTYGHIEIYLKVNNVWTKIIDGHGDSTSWILFSNHVTTGWNLVTGVRISHPTDYTESKIHDLSVFEL